MAQMITGGGDQFNDVLHELWTLANRRKGKERKGCDDRSALVKGFFFDFAHDTHQVGVAKDVRGGDRCLRSPSMTTNAAAHHY
jgi:hypothetical protein